MLLLWQKDNVVSQREYEGTGTRSTTLVSSTDFTYADKTNYLTGVKHFSPLGTQEIGYRYGNLANGEMPDQIYSVSWNGKEKVNYTYDGLGRLTNKKIGAAEQIYTYEDVGTNRTTTLANSVKTPAGTYTYTYDNLGNITSISNGEFTTTYEYDSLNQLVRENDEQNYRTYTYSYSNGNITEKKEYEYTTGELGDVLNAYTWKYEDGTWSDLLTDFDGTQFKYDEIGNPVNIGDSELTWNGRQLTNINGNDLNISYAYNGDGLRISKEVDGVKTEYFYNGSLLAGQKTGDDVIVFMYDNNGDIFGFTYNGTEYYYVKNLQNDVTAITDSNGNIIVNYYYDAWGNPTGTTGDFKLAEINPIRYRSYYFDEETGFYYLNSRYYASTIGRFLNADEYSQTGQGMLDKNVFAYCENNPVVRADDSGQIWHIVISAAVGALISAVVDVAVQAISGQEINLAEVGIAALSGAASGALAATGVGVLGMIAGNAAISMAENTANQVITNKGFSNFNVGDMLIDGVIGGALGAIGGHGKGTKHLNNLGRRTIKRSFSTGTHKGMKAGLKEFRKALVYYSKNTKSYYKKYLRSLPFELASSFGSSLASSKYAKNMYYRKFRR